MIPIGKQRMERRHEQETNECVPSHFGARTSDISIRLVRCVFPI